MKRFLILFFILCLECEVAQSTSIRIYGFAPEYAGTIIEFQQESNPIVLSNQILGSCHIDSTGHFNVEFELDSVARINIPLEANNGFFYAEPGKSYQLQFPPLKKKTQAEKRSPFFCPTMVLLKIMNQDTGLLNKSINQLDSIFYCSLQKDLKIIFTQHSKLLVEKIKQQLDQCGQNCTLPFFVNYRQYRKNYLDCIVQAQNNNKNIRLFLAQQPIFINNPAYLEVFRLLSKDFMKGLTSPKGKSLEELINEGSWDELNAVLTEEFHFSAEVAGLFILQNLYDGFYNKDYNKAGILTIIKTMAAKTKSSTLQSLAKETYNSLIWLIPGSLAPSFSLKDSNKQIHSIEEFKGKYLYLNFIATDDYSCREHLNVLSELAKKYSQNLTIVSIAVDDNFSNASDFFKQKGYQWTLLDGSNNKDIIKTFRVKAIPHYLFINRSGNIVNNEALSPFEDFASEFNSVLLQEH